MNDRTNPDLALAHADTALPGKALQSSAMYAPIQPNITFAMIKSDAFRNGVDGKVLQAIRAAGFIVIKSCRSMQLGMNQIKEFYADHLDRPYFPDLLHSVDSSVMPMILELPHNKHSAVKRFRRLIGATDARTAELGTLRHHFGGHNFDPNVPMAYNAIHGSDSLASMVREIKCAFYFDLPSHTAVFNSRLYGNFYLRDFDTNATYPD